MILTPDNEFSVVLDACVLAPMPLCDTLLRLAEDPALYRPLWSDTILEEVGMVLLKLKRTEEQAKRRISVMREHFPEALVAVPPDLIEAISCIPDADDRHVLAAAIRAGANGIVTSNVKDFPEECLKQYDVLCQTPDEFLINQFHLSPELVLEKLDAQGANIRQDRAWIATGLGALAPEFSKLVLATG